MSHYLASTFVISKRGDKRTAGHRSELTRVEITKVEAK